MRLFFRLIVLVTTACLAWSAPSLAKDAAPPKKKYHYNPFKDDPNYKFYISGNLALAPELIANAKDFREVYIEMYTADGDTSRPYAWTKYVLIAPPTAGNFLEFRVTEKNIHFTSLYPDRSLPMPVLKVRMTKIGLMGVESPGDLVGTIQGVKLGDDELVVTVNRVAAPLLAH